MATATFAAGCFWGVEDTFRRVAGVLRTRVGYTGGRTENPTYRDVCSHTTGHAEAVEVTYNPDVVSYDDLLKVFWASHDPTQVNRQGPDIGDSYRTAIFTHDSEQASAARESRNAEQTKYKRPIATEITPTPEFWVAEEYHQQYFEKNSGASCAVGGWLRPNEGESDSILTHEPERVGDS
jgi:peptide-methionine (S)-S-oxide reductase